MGPTFATTRVCRSKTGPPRPAPSTLHQLKPRRNLRRLAQHDAGRAVFFVAHGDGEFGGY